MELISKEKIIREIKTDFGCDECSSKCNTCLIDKVLFTIKNLEPELVSKEKLSAKDMSACETAYYKGYAKAKIDILTYINDMRYASFSDGTHDLEYNLLGKFIEYIGGE